MAKRWLSIVSAVALLAAAPAGAQTQGQPPAAQTPSAPAPAPEKNSNVTVYGGYRFSSGLSTDNGGSWQLTEGPSFAVAANFGIDSKSQYELLVSYRNSSLKASGFSPAAPFSDKIHLGVTYYHIGGTYFVDNIGKGVYVVGGLGATHFDPGGDLSSELRFSLNLGVGYMIPLGQSLALKLEGRGYITLINSSGGFLCSGGCVVQVKGDTLTQGEVLAGLAYRF